MEKKGRKPKKETAREKERERERENSWKRSRGSSDV